MERVNMATARRRSHSAPGRARHYYGRASGAPEALLDSPPHGEPAPAEERAGAGARRASPQLEAGAGPPMNAIVATLQAWLGEAERLAGRLPELAALLRGGGWAALAGALAVGLALLVAGSRLGRFLAGAGAALVGFWVGGMIAPAVHGWLPATLPPWVGAAVLGLSAVMTPVVYPIVLGLAPGALLGMHVAVAGKAWLGGVAGGIVLALVAVLLRRLVLAATAALAGAALVAAGLLALAARWPALEPLARRPIVLLGVAAVLAIAGTAFQLGAGVERAGRPRNRIDAEGGRKPLED
jgi:hypothetical protein